MARSLLFQKRNTQDTNDSRTIHGQDEKNLFSLRASTEPFDRQSIALFLSFFSFISDSVNLDGDGAYSLISKSPEIVHTGLGPFPYQSCDRSSVRTCQLASVCGARLCPMMSSWTW